LRKIGELDYREIEYLPVDTITLLREAFSIAADIEQAPKRHLHLEIPESLPMVCGDFDLLLLTIYNVMNNAIKYSAEGDDISLYAASANGQIVISIADTGSGIAPNDLPYVWDELYRSERVKGTGGSGIGLALVKRVIERHNGAVAINSQVDQGTTVFINLPIHVAD
jgi:two-component system, OmpR family, sensor kinase